MQQLSGMDASFLYAETPRAHMAGGGVCDLRPVDGARRTGHVQGDPGRTSTERLPRGPGVPPAAGAGAVRPRSPVLDRGPRLRPRVPRPPHRPAEAGRLAPAVHPGRPAALPPARPRPPAVGALRHRGLGQRRRRAEGQLRARHQGPPRGHRRHVRHGDDDRHPRRLARRPTPTVLEDRWRPGADRRRRPSCCGRASAQQRRPADALRPGDGPHVAPARPAAAPDPAPDHRAAADHDPADPLERPGDRPPGVRRRPSRPRTTAGDQATVDRAPRSTTSC